ncbi:hypothetical protein BS78_05G237300 [Paspalum vaginatum]|nr:hypothetical protein BS78_05G237300 [Paspalum vaginatum]
MEATGWEASDCGHDGRWSYDEQASCYSAASSSSGTIVSTATYTASSASRLSSVSIRAAMGILERWLKELCGDGWALRVVAADGASAGILELAPKPLFPADRSSMGLLTSVSEEKEPSSADENGKHTSRQDRLQIAQFLQQTMLKMYPSVDSVFNEDLLVTNGAPVLPPHVKFRTLLRVHLALSNALSECRFRVGSPTSAEAQRIESEMVSLLSTKEDSVREIIWSTLQEINARILQPMEEGSSRAQTPPVSSSIHKLTWSVMGHVTFLLENFWAVAPIVSEAKRLGRYVPHHQTTRDAPPLDSMIMEMMSCLQEKLVGISELFPDQGLRFLFLLNNAHFLWEKLQCYTQTLPPFGLDRFSREVIRDKLKGYKNRYQQVSWVPVLSCLLNPTTPTMCFGTSYSPLSKFESKFQETYTAQKQWKVPDPKLRKMLRRAVAKKIVAGYEKYIEDNVVTTLKFTPKELEEMLQELFEG